jgi:CRISPR/Cas system-associated endonuclease Cas1
MGRTLYLAEGEPLRILRDGPSLWIEKEGRAGRRVPVRLIERVVIVGKVPIDSSVITLLASYDIPVFFINLKGQETAICLSNRPSTLRYSQRQSIFKASKENRTQYTDLLMSWRRRMQIHFLKRAFRNKGFVERLLSRGFTERQFKEIVRSLAGDHKDGFYAARSIMKGILLETTIVRLKKAGFDPHNGVLHEGKRFGLAHDICYVFEPEISLQAIKFTRNKQFKSFIKNGQLTPQGIKDLAQRYENRATLLVVLIDRLLKEVTSLLLELELNGTFRIVTTGTGYEG